MDKFLGDEKGFSAVELVIVVAVILLVILSGVIVWHKTRVKSIASTAQSSSASSSESNPTLQYSNEQKEISGYKAVADAFMTDFQENQPAKAYPLTSTLVHQTASSSETDFANVFQQAKNKDQTSGVFTQSQEDSSTLKGKNFVAVQYEFSGNNSNYTLVILEEDSSQWYVDQFQVGPNNYSLFTALQSFEFNYPWEQS